MKVFLKFNGKLTIDVMIESLKNSLENHNEVAVLATCFMIPDVFSKKMNGDKKEKYIKCLICTLRSIIALPMN